MLDVLWFASQSGLELGLFPSKVSRIDNGGVACPAAEVPEVVKLNRPVWFDGWFRFGIGGLTGDLIGLELEEWLWMLLWLLGMLAIWSLLWICELWWSRRATLPCLPCVLSTGSINGDRDSKAGDLIGVELLPPFLLQALPHLEHKLHRPCLFVKILMGRVLIRVHCGT
jgi:hypothetical protein